MYDTATDEKFMRRALELAAECAEADEVPVGAVVVKDGSIVAEGCNFKERENSAVRHAEIVALESAAKALGNWWLEDCDVYVTLEPCPMCAGAMINARVRRVVFGAYDPKTGAAGSRVDLFRKGLFNHDVEVTGGVPASSRRSAHPSSPPFSAKNARKKPPPPTTTSDRKELLRGWFVLFLSGIKQKTSRGEVTRKSLY